MPLTPAQIEAAESVQHAAACDPSQHVRVVAGPGTGKSSAIEERIRWLLAQGVSPAAIYAVSFTRSSALDLRQRVHAYCMQNGQPAATQVRVTTLHSLALRTLRAAGLLAAYPAEPLVMDGWELENVFDAEFGHASQISKGRREKIRLDHEAFWSTGQWGPPNYVPPNPAITAAERAQFSAFHGPRTQCYACVLPGEIVRQCVTQMAAGTLNAVGLLNLAHLVIDEYQDLNPMDLQFVDGIVGQGARVFVAGDDDQSIYSFRFASPAGIQAFVTKYPLCGQHTLSACFRCTPAVLTAGQALIAANPQPNRIPKNHASLYGSAVPPLTGFTQRWQFPSGIAEARAIAESCRDLIAAGINPRDILVLLSNQRALLPGLDAEFRTVGVAYEPPRAEGFLDSRAGRWVLAAIRIVCDADDYVAHRVLLGLRPGVGIGTCSTVADGVIANNLNYQSIFYQPLPAAVFAGQALTALNHARTLCAQIQGWQAADPVVQHVAAIGASLTAIFAPADGQAWQAFASALPSGMTLEELRDYLWADTDEQQSAILQAVMTRLNLPIPAAGVLPPRVRVMTMHGAKGLSSKIVFVPGIEEEILPGPWRQPYPGLVLEAARLLYVSITRARAACIMSYARTRMVYGQFGPQTVSRFAAHLGGAFAARTSGLTGVEIAQITNEVSQL
ncbi:MAG: ATP-dependent helicase [Planctomycetes bacterium]|nr:ATP-dependent helicase [Planctomycetota bacterium]